MIFPGAGLRQTSVYFTGTKKMPYNIVENTLPGRSNNKLYSFTKLDIVPVTHVGIFVVLHNNLSNFFQTTKDLYYNCYPSPD